jgi:hypothetical protein
MPNPEARRRRREARNEELFREAAESLGAEAAEVEFLCECGRTACTETVRILLTDYLRVRSWDTRFFVLRGHEDLEAEKVVEPHSGWLVVQTLEPFRPDPPGERRGEGRPWSGGRQ